MMEGYLFSIPGTGEYRWVAIFAAPLGAAVLSLAGALVCRYSRSATVRKQFQALRAVSAGAAALFILYALLRGAGAPVLSFRAWFYLILGAYLLWLAWWMLRLRILPHDLVVERERRRTHGYQRRGRRRR